MDMKAQVIAIANQKGGVGKTNTCASLGIGLAQAGKRVSLVNAMSRETILRQYLDTVRNQYTHILIDCQSSLGMLTVNTLAAADRVIVTVQTERWRKPAEI